MDQIILPTMPEEFLAWEPFQEGAYEFDGHQPVCLNGRNVAHARISANVIGELHDRQRGSPGEVLGGSMKVRCGSSLRHPDASVACTRAPAQAAFVDHPVILFEIVSPGREADDHVTKLREYRLLSSLRRYVIVEQDVPLLTVHSRTASGWEASSLTVRDALHLPEIGVVVPVAELYRRVLPSA